MNYFIGNHKFHPLVVVAIVFSSSILPVCASAKEIAGTGEVRVEEKVIDAHIGLWLISPSEVKEGDKVQASATVLNIGDIQWAFYVTFAVQDPNSKWWNAPFEQLVLAPNEKKSCTLRWEADPSAPPGSYNTKITVWKDIKDDIPVNELSSKYESQAFKIVPYQQIYGYVKYKKSFLQKVPLHGVKVDVSRKGSSDTMTTYTDGDGYYSFSGLDLGGKYTIEVGLTDGKYIEILDEQANSELVKKSETIKFTENRMQKDVVFSRGNENEAARIFQYLFDAVQFFVNTLVFRDLTPESNAKGELDWDLPVKVHIDVESKKSGASVEVTPNLETGEPVSSFISFSGHYCRIDADSDVYVHELSHHMFLDLYQNVVENYHTGCPGGVRSHMGDDNPCTCNGYIEGWAEFMPCVIKNDEIFQDENMELNWHHAIDHPFFALYEWTGRIGQEFAITGILWDLYDGNVGEQENYFIVDGGGDAWFKDNVQLSIAQIWVVLCNPDIFTVKDLYFAFRDSGYISNIQDLKNIFIAHGWNPDSEGW